MSIQNKAALRAATRIHARLHQPSGSTPEICLPEICLPDTAWNACVSIARKVRKAERRGWHAAARWLRNELAHTLGRVRSELGDVCQCLTPPASTAVMPPQQIYQDLIALHNEFEEFEIDIADAELSATTEPIELEGLQLGPFKIVLHWRNIGQHGPYEVIAVDPRPTHGDDDVVHPHVKSDALCEGDARMPIRHALRQGRLLDFFVIVRQTLQTYNRSSAYVGIDEWDGRRCTDCGATMYADETCSCERCNTYVCGECSVSCTGCDRPVCGDCYSRCEACGDVYCSGCLQPCAGCKTSLCKECLTDDQCSDCRDGRAERTTVADEDGDAAQDDRDSDAPLHTHRVGEVGVPA